jgi:hypothetical protein
MRTHERNQTRKKSEMKNMMNTMIPLTVANTLNQTAKQRIEAKPNQTLKQVVQAQKLSPEGDFDVYDQMGKVISNQSVANHRDNTVYVGVAKVAGGANHPGLDLDDDDAWDLDEVESDIMPNRMKVKCSSKCTSVRLAGRETVRRWRSWTTTAMS